MLLDLLCFDFMHDVRKIKKGGIVYFRGIDVCDGFGYHNYKYALRDHVPILNKRIFREIDYYHEGDTIYIDLCGVYQLFLNSGIEYFDNIPDM